MAAQDFLLLFLLVFGFQGMTHTVTADDTAETSTTAPATNQPVVVTQPIVTTQPTTPTQPTTTQPQTSLLDLLSVYLYLSEGELESPLLTSLLLSEVLGQQQQQSTSGSSILGSLGASNPLLWAMIEN